ncbi:ankyrin repeat domain-containing protein [Wolbachia endosymbiont (group E) of Neria commutata]|uniref:ankyrin repeat domain-containing protein n=1 Tax=Wolbachia endosymbiont (group E) of Neria commutata TaxID=3066149 RepID=UPI003132FCBF
MAIFVAADDGYENIVKLLIEKGADVNAKNKYGEAILHFAVVEGNLEIVKLLLEHGANINYQGSYNDTVLHEAIKNRHRDITEYLINVEDINLNLQNKEGKTTLHLAVLYGYSEIVRLLVEKKSSLDIQDKFGQAALHIAINRGHSEVAQLIIEHMLIRNETKPDFLNEKLLNHWTKCTTEIEEMQNLNVGDSKISFFDILIADKKKLASCVNDDNIIKVLDTYDYEGNFPVYADKIKNQYKKGMNEKVAADIILNLSKNEDGDNVLVEGTSRMICNLLDYKVIRDLCKAGYRNLIEKRHTNTETAPEQPVEADATIRSCFSDVGVEKYANCVTQQNKT